MLLDYFVVPNRNLSRGGDHEGNRPHARGGQPIHSALYDLLNRQLGVFSAVSSTTDNEVSVNYAPQATGRPGFARLLAWGLLTGLIVRDDLTDEFRADAAAVGEMVEAFRREAPDATGDAAAIIATSPNEATTNQLAAMIASGSTA